MRRLSTILGCLAVIALGLTLQAMAQVEIKEAPVTWKQVALGDGEDLYTELCAVCHGVDGTGNGPAVPALSTPVPDLTKLALGNEGEFPVDEVRKVITGETAVVAHGTREMPVWGRVLQEVRPDMKQTHREGFARLRIYNLTAYLETLQVE